MSAEVGAAKLNESGAAPFLRDPFRQILRSTQRELFWGGPRPETFPSSPVFCDIIIVVLFVHLKFGVRSVDSHRVRFVYPGPHWFRRAPSDSANIGLRHRLETESLPAAYL